jgi:hypothetical protein
MILYLRHRRSWNDLAKLTTDDLVQIVEQYFKCGTLGFVKEDFVYEGVKQTKAKLIFNTVVNIGEKSYGVGPVTEIIMHGYWKGKHYAGNGNSSKSASVQIIVDGKPTREFDVENRQTMLDVQLPDFLPHNGMALPQGNSASPVSKQDWVSLLKRLAGLLDNERI